MRTRLPVPTGVICLLAGVSLLASSLASAMPPIREAFFTAYPGAVGSRLDNLPSRSGHCGVCHFRFAGGGPRNPYGVAVQGALGSFPDTPEGIRDAILSVENADSDGDTFANLVEITDLANYSNTPTFPGLTPLNVGEISRIDEADVLPYLVPEAVTGAPEGVASDSWARVKSLYR